MKVVYLAIVFLWVTCHSIRAQECQDSSSTICPRSFPVQSNPSIGICDSPDAADIRGRIQQQVAGTVSDQLYTVLRAKYLGLNPNVSAENCAEIRRYRPDAESRSYYLQGSEMPVYCNFDLQTPSDTNNFGWARLAFADLSDTGTNCPGSEFNLVEGPAARYCVKSVSGFGCNSVWYAPPFPVKRIYGRVTGIQIGTGDIISGRSIDEPYLDGVSLTYGSAGNRQHIWSFMAYTSEAFNQCPCSTDTPTSTPGFVENNYFCESGTQQTDNFLPPMVYADDPLWDGQQCGLTEVPCCGMDMSPPWFYREFVVPTEDRVELRICTDQEEDDENVGLQLVELWVQ